MCDRDAGACVCEAGYHGDACEKLDCPGGRTNPCNGHGRCITMKQASQLYDGHRWVHEASYAGAWDADRVQGCWCDEGYSGYDCSQRQCAFGDDPTSTSALSLVPEQQTVACTCPGTCSGYFLVRAYGRFSDPIAFNAVAETADETSTSPATGTGKGESLQSKLNAMLSRPLVSAVSFSGGGSALCSSSGNTATVTFVSGAGDAPLLELVAADTLLSGGTSVRDGAATSIAAAELTRGTTVSLECSGRGTCDRATGTCTCQAGYGPSDGGSGAGTVDDCGSHDGATALGCPGSASACSGNGICESSGGEHQCRCFRGFKGADCSRRSCPSSAAWFDEARETDRAHYPAECSNRGVCNEGSGDCQCDPGYEGAACQRKRCPSTRAQGECGGRGLCKTVGQLALLGHFGGDYAGGGRNEVQRIACSLGSGSFRLTFSHAQTRPIQWDDGLAALQNRLEELPTVGFVQVTQVTPSGGTQVCAAGGASVDVEFTSDFGSLPLLQADSASVSVSRQRASTRVTYGATRGKASTWDADKLQGCHCGRYPDFNKTDEDLGDKGHWDGPACSLRTCPYGNDARIGRPLRYRVQCTADGGSLTWSFSGEQAALTMPHGADEGAVLRAIESIPGVERAIVSLEAGASAACGSPTAASFQAWIYTNVDETAVGHLGLGNNGLTLGAGSGSATVTYLGSVLGVENQTVSCLGDGGSFRLSFRGRRTAAIPHGASATDLKGALEALPTLGVVRVTMSTATSTVCSAAGSGESNRAQSSALPGCAYPRS